MTTIVGRGGNPGVLAYTIETVFQPSRPVGESYGWVRLVPQTGARKTGRHFKIQQLHGPWVSLESFLAKHQKFWGRKWRITIYIT